MAHENIQAETNGRMAKGWAWPMAIAVTAVVVAGCSSITTGSKSGGDPVDAPGSEQVGSSGPADIEPIEASILELLPESEGEDYEEGERYLLSLAVSPIDLPHALRIFSVQVDDPNGNTRIGDRWYEPRILERDCAFETDQPPIPFTRVGYLPGDPSESTSTDSFAGLGAPSIGLELTLFDTASQRDAFAQVMRDSTFMNLECSMTDSAPSDLFPSVKEVPPIDIGHPGFGFRSEGGLSPGAVGYQYALGDRVLLRVGANTGVFGDESAQELDPDVLESLLRQQVARLEAAGLG